MIKIFNNFLLDGDRFMPKLHLREAGFTYSACGIFAKRFKNELNNACFAHDAAYSDSKELAKRNISDKVLKDKV